MRVKLCVRARTRRETWRITTIPKPHFTCARGATANKGCPGITTHAKPTGEENAQQPPMPSPRHSEALRHLWREVRSNPVLLLASCALFQNVR